MLPRVSWMLGGVLGMAVLLVGCGNAQREATEAAISAAQAALNAIEGEAQKYAPDQWAAAEKALQEAKGALARGQYEEALRAAQDAASKARLVAASAEAKKEEWEKRWAKFSESLPKSLDAAKAKVEAYSHGARLPAGMDNAKLAEAKNQFNQLKQGWSDATALAAQGHLGEAVRKAEELQVGLVQLLETLGSKPPK